MPTTPIDDPTLSSDAPVGHSSAPEASRPAVTDVLICLPSLNADTLSARVNMIAAAFPGESVLIASPDHSPDPQLNWTSYSSDRAGMGWVLAAADYAAAARLAAERDAKVILLIGNEMPLDPAHLRSLAECVRSKNVDLALPRFHLDPGAGLVSAAILYPLTRALFTSDIYFPLPVDAALSPRMAARLAAPTQRLFVMGQGQALIWPVAEAAIAGFSVRQTDVGSDSPPPPPTTDFNALFTSVTSSLFADIDAKANFWQRARNSPVRPPLSAPLSPPVALSEDTVAQVAEMTESFQLAYANLQEIWSFVLPPQSRLALKKLSLTAPNAFTMDPALWARIVYDFALAFHLRTLNRGHLLGAMTPLYLSWAASHLRAIGDDRNRAARSIEDNALAFEAEKPYMVSRWRWPDRFNP
jgi:hypothetical protein